MKTTRILAVACALIVAAACGSSKTSSLQDLRERSAAIQRETKQHGKAVAGATSLSAIPDLEAEHKGAMDGELGMMNDDVSNMMMTCGSSMMAGLAGELDQLDQECAAHIGTMLGAATMNEAQAEESRHQWHMSTLLDAMGSMTGPSCDGGSGGMMP